MKTFYTAAARGIRIEISSSALLAGLLWNKEMGQLAPFHFTESLLVILTWLFTWNVIKELAQASGECKSRHSSLHRIGDDKQLCARAESSVFFRYTLKYVNYIVESEWMSALRWLVAVNWRRRWFYRCFFMISFFLLIRMVHASGRIAVKSEREICGDCGSRRERFHFSYTCISFVEILWYIYCIRRNRFTGIHGARNCRVLAHARLIHCNLIYVHTSED